MKQQRFRYKLAALFLSLLFLLAGLYGLRAVSQYGNRWFSYAATPRLSALKERVSKGDILDRNGVLLASDDLGQNRRVWLRKRSRQPVA